MRPQFDEIALTLSTADAAELLGVCGKTLERSARNGTAPVEPIRVGRCLRWPTAPIVKLLGLAEETAEDSSSGPPRLTLVRGADAGAVSTTAVSVDPG